MPVLISEVWPLAGHEAARCGLPAAMLEERARFGLTNPKRQQVRLADALGSYPADSRTVTLEGQAVFHTDNISIPAIRRQGVAPADVQIMPVTKIGPDAELRVNDGIAAGVLRPHLGQFLAAEDRPTDEL